MAIVELVSYQTPCAKVTKLRFGYAKDGGSVWADWCYKHHHWLNGEHGVTRTASDELLESCAPLSENARNA